MSDIDDLKVKVYDLEQTKAKAVKDADDWHLAYDTLCTDLAYTLGMDSPTVAGDHQVKARVAKLVTELARAKRRGDVHRDRVNDESARAYSQGVEDMREKAARTVRAYSDDLDELAGEIHDATLTGDEAKTYPPGMSWLKVFDEEKGRSSPDPHGGEEVSPGSIRAAEDALEASLAAQEPDLASRVAALEADMRQAQAALRGLGADSPPTASCANAVIHGPHQWTTDDGTKRHCMGAY